MCGRVKNTDSIYHNFHTREHININSNLIIWKAHEAKMYNYLYTPIRSLSVSCTFSQVLYWKWYTHRMQSGDETRILFNVFTPTWLLQYQGFSLCTFYPKVWHELLVGLKVICWDRSQEAKQLSWGVSHSSGRCQGSPSRSLLKATPESHQSNVCATMCMLNIERSFGNPIKQLIRIRMAGMSWNSNLEKRYQHQLTVCMDAAIGSIWSISHATTHAVAWYPQLATMPLINSLLLFQKNQLCSYHLCGYPCLLCHL